MDSDESFLHRLSDSKNVFLLAYVCDILLIGPDEISLKRVAKEISKKVDFREGKSVERILGVHISQRKRDIQISNPLLLRSISVLLNMSDSKPSVTPISTGITIQKDEDGVRRSGPFQELIMEVLYLATTVRPDIAFSVGRLAKVLHQSPANNIGQRLKECLYTLMVRVTWASRTIRILERSMKTQIETSREIWTTGSQQRDSFSNLRGD